MLASHDQDILCSRACLSDGVESTCCAGRVSSRRRSEGGEQSGSINSAEVRQKTLQKRIVQLASFLID
jgi:hypothetical protein